MPTVLFAAPERLWPRYEPALAAPFAEAGLSVTMAGPQTAPAEVDYLIYAPNGPVSDFTPFTRARAVLSLWAGVEGIVGNDTITMPLTRMVDPGLTQGMIDWVTGHALRHHAPILRP